MFNFFKRTNERLNYLESTNSDNRDKMQELEIIIDRLKDEIFQFSCKDLKEIKQKDIELGNMVWIRNKYGGLSHVIVYQIDYECFPLHPDIECKSIVVYDSENGKIMSYNGPCYVEANNG